LGCPHREVLRPENPLTSQFRIIEVVGFKPMEGAVRVGRAIKAGAFRRHSTKQHLKEALRHQTDFVTKRNSDGEPPYVLFRAFVFRANDQPFATAQPKLAAIAVVATVSWPQDFEKIAENIVIDALFRNSRDDLSTGNRVSTTIDGLGMEAPGLPAADCSLQDIDGPVEFRRPHGKTLGLGAKVEGQHAGESLQSFLSFCLRHYYTRFDLGQPPRADCERHGIPAPIHSDCPRRQVCSP